jgi:hypothetical protein
MTASVWSAIAATFSAVSAFVMILIQRRNLLEAARPELVLTGFARLPDAGIAGAEKLTVKSIRNVGKGAALNLHINASHTVEKLPLVIMGTERIPIIAPNETVDWNAEILVWWKNVPERHHRHLNVPITIWCWDARNIRHITDYQFMLAAPELARMHINEEVPGLIDIRRTTTSRPVWLLKFLRRPRWLVRATERMRATRKRIQERRAKTGIASGVQTPEHSTIQPQD